MQFSSLILLGLNLSVQIPYMWLSTNNLRFICMDMLLTVGYNFLVSKKNENWKKLLTKLKLMSSDGANELLNLK
jgi:hypothetical protein